jgi:apolipoprotein N-acyltransferase
LAVSQYTTLAMIQAARWGGVGLVSALVVLMNLAIGFTAMRYIASRGRHRGRWHPELALALVCCALAHTDGYRYLMRMPQSDTAVRAALIQPNISQFEKWTPEFIDKIYSRLGDLTASALYAGPSDLVVWPETALPDDVRISPYSYDFVYSLATQGVPVLVGSMDTVWDDDGEPVYYNTSFLFGKNGHIVERYDKQHLVIFGEYVPFGEVFTFMKALTPIAESFSGGHESTLFELDTVPAPFSVLICFEDTIAALARRAVRCGARLLINQTNDAWFDGSSGARQHLAHCVFRAVENDVPIIRVANSGVSCRIDPRGRILDVIDDGQGNTQVAGFRMTRAPIYPEGTPTFYNRHGEWFALGCTIIGVLALLVTIRPPKKLPS